MDQLSRQEATVEKIRMSIDESVHLTGAVLVGSFAIGDTDPLSDIDLIVVTMPGEFDAAWTKRCELHGDAAITCWDVRDQSTRRHGAHKRLTQDLVLVDCLFAEPGSGVRLAPPYQILTGGSSVADALVPRGRIPRDEVTGELNATMEEALRTVSVEDAYDILKSAVRRGRRRFESEDAGMPGRQIVSTGTVWEERAGFSRAVRVGEQIFVSGTTATDPHSNPVGVGDPAAQAQFILEKIKAALEELGASMTDVVRWRCYLVNADDWMQVSDVLGAYFRDVRPASTLYEVSRLVGDEYLVEIEVDAIVGSGTQD